MVPITPLRLVPIQRYRQPEAKYDKDKLSFGFLDGYFKYEPTDKKKDFLKRLERILADYSDNEDLKDEVSKLNLIVDEINHKN